MNQVLIRKSGAAGALGLLAIVASVALLSGVLLGAGEWLLLGGAFLLCVAVSVFLVGWRGFEDRHGWLLTGGWVVMLSAPLLNNVSGVPIGYILELFLFGLVVAAARGWWSLATRDATTRLLLFVLVLHFAVALLSTALGRSHAVAAFWQLQYNLKWPLMFGLGALVVWTPSVDRVMRAIIGWSWLIIVPSVLLEMLLPGIHSELFGPYVDTAINPFIDAGTRYRGPFAHAGSLAIVGALLTAGACVYLLTSHGVKWGAVAVLYLSVVIASGQRQELAALVFTLVLFVAIHWRRNLHLMLMVGLSLAVVVVVALVYMQHVPMQRTFAQWGLLDSITPLSERATLTQKGIEVAQQYFPLGSGLGTYGGPGAQKFDQSLFIDLGFGNLWWFRQGKFLVDTYWPCVIAESGFFGAALLLSFFAVMWSGLLIRAWRAKGTTTYPVALLGLASLTLLLGNTPSSPMLTDPRGAVAFWLVIAAAWRATIVQGVSAGDRRAARTAESHEIRRAIPGGHGAG